MPDQQKNLAHFKHCSNGRRKTIMDYVAVFNLIEAIWWFLVAGFIAAGRVPSLRDYPWAKLALVAGFGLFGISDLIEIATGAWWRPVELLLLKAACIATFIAVTIRVAVADKRKSQSGNAGG